MKRLKYYKFSGYTFTFLTCRIKVYNYCVNVTLTVAINKHSDRSQLTVADEVFPWAGSYKTSHPLFAFTNLAVGTSMFSVQSMILAFDFIESTNGGICLIPLYIRSSVFSDLSCQDMADIWCLLVSGRRMLPVGPLELKVWPRESRLLPVCAADVEFDWDLQRLAAGDSVFTALVCSLSKFRGIAKHIVQLCKANVMSPYATMWVVDVKIRFT